MTKPFTFAEQLRVGSLGEAFIIGAHPELHFPRVVGERRWDLEEAVDGVVTRTVEVKTDTYPMLESPNFFWERRTNLRRKRVSLEGGPWRSVLHGVNELVYLYSNSGTRERPGDPVAYWFSDLPALVARIEELVTSGVAKPRRVRSVDVSAFGYIAPRSEFNDALCTQVVYRPQ